MPDSCAALKEAHQPQVLVETAGLSEKEWLAYRRKGIGGSDVAALLGISPWRTARDLYYDKLNIAAVEDNEENWVALEMGHLLEPLVAKIFQHRTGYKIYQVKKMFQHPKYPWMLADVDYFVELPDGTTAILEIKTTNYNAKDHWWLNGEETVPVYYETQGRHYMAVMNVDRCFFCCLYGNNEEETIIREIRRDEAYEDEMIFLEQHFWENYVLAKTPPPYTEEGDLVIESVRRHTGPADKDAPVVTFDYSLTAKLMRYLQLQEEKKRAEKNSKEIDADMQRLKGALIAEMGKSCKAICQQDGVNYTVTYNPVRKPMAERLHYDTSDEIVYRVRKLRQRHDELVLQSEAGSLEEQASKMAAKYPHVNDICMELQKKYAYSDGDYTVLAPQNIFAIIKEGRMLHHCVGNDGSGERYYERIERRESFIMFLRRTDEPEDPYYTLEIEPDGTVRQKRTLFDRQYEDIEQATEFLLKWQKVIATRLTGRDLKLAERSRELRKEEFIQMQKDRVIIHTGHLAGRLLADVLLAVLMENTEVIQPQALPAAA